MIGVDIVKIERFESSEWPVIERILHPFEITEYMKSENKAKYIATKWAIKEALFKADNSNSTFNKINIVKKNERYFFDDAFEITTSDEDGYVVAFVIKKAFNG